MRRAFCIGVAIAALTAAALGQSPVPTASSTSRAQQSGAAAARAMLDTYCVGCHNSRARAGGVAFDALTFEAVHEDADVWEAAVRKLRGRLMPPPGSRQPDQREIDAFVTWMEGALDAAAARGPVAGHVPIQRLTRTEFGTAVSDLLGIELDATQLLPAEIEVNGFDNIAAALSVSPAFLDQYVGAARVAARLAVGESAPKVASATYAQPEGGDQPAHIDGLPLGTRGGMRFRHNFPADGEYRFTISDLGLDLYTRAVETRHTLIMLVDGREVFRESVGGPDDLRTLDRGGAPGRAEVMKRFASIPVQVTAGTRDVAVTFIERARVESDEFVGFLPGDAFSRGDREPRVQGGVQVVGPFNSPGVSETESRRRIFVCRPPPLREPREGTNRGRVQKDVPWDDRACARRIAVNLARRAFRRPVTDADIDSLMPYFDKTARADFDSRIEQVVAAVLVSPEFLFRAIRTPAGAENGKAFPLSDLELASRLSFFLWSSGPDDTLLQIAAAGKLRAPEVLRAQALRMLNDRRASSLVRNFALKALDLDKLADVVPDPNLFPTFDDGLRRDLATEIESFLASVLLEDRNVGDLLTANHTFLNERLARHYGIRSVLGPQFRRVTLEDGRRWGLIGKGAVLLRTSYPDRTSPVLRGAWVLGKLMGTPPTPPPPDVETDLSNATGEAPKTLRARLESHRAKPGCNQCHGVIDPIGLAMENFDAIGRWRDRDLEAKAPIDAKTVLPDGRTVDGPIQLREALFGGRDLFVRAFTEKLMMYAVGRELKSYDLPQIRSVVRKAEAQDYRLSALVAGIVTSDAFRMQSPPGSRDESKATAATASKD
jgi:mono/diheme cytochrome c family protein